MARAKGSGDPAKVFFDSHEMAHLRQLEILASKVFKGQLRGERETSRRGPGTSFREHRDYHAGDPLRLIDWNVLARMDLLVVKEFDAEVSLDVVLLQDCSESMRGAAARCAAKVTAALGAVAMPHMDRVLWAPVGGVGTRTADVFTGRGRLPDLFSAVDREPGGATDLMGALRGAVPRKSRGGVAFVMSDFFDPKGVGQALSYLVSRRFQVRVMLIEDPGAAAAWPHDLKGRGDRRDHAARHHAGCRRGVQQGARSPLRKPRGVRAPHGIGFPPRACRPTVFRHRAFRHPARVVAALSFYDPAGFWLGLAAGGVLLAHLIRRRARRVTVPFLPLWAAALGERRGGFGSRLMRYLDLLLVLIACAAVAVAAAGPYTKGTPSTARDLVLVLDGGLELRAGDRHRLLWHVARAEIQRRAPGTRFLIVRVSEGRDSSVRCADDRAAMAEVSRHQPAWQRRSPEHALALARAAASDLRDPDFVFVTYRAIAPENWRLRVVKQSAQNAGFASLEVTGDPEGGGRFARVTLRGEGPATIGEFWKGELVAGEPTVLQLPLPREGEAEFTIVSEGDAFAADDTIRLLLPGRERPRPLVVSDTGEVSPFLISALTALEATGAIIGPLEQTVPARAAEAAKDYSVVIFDRCAPPRTLTGVPVLYLSPPGGALPFRVGEEHPAPALFHVEREHPLVRGIDLERIPPLNGRAVLGGEAIATAAPGALRPLHLRVHAGVSAVSPQRDRVVGQGHAAFRAGVLSGRRSIAENGPRTYRR